MSRAPESPVPEGDDPIDSGDVGLLRAEILRLRDLVVGGSARRELLRDRINELEEVHHRADALQERVNHLEGLLVVRIRRRLGRLVPGRS